MSEQAIGASRLPTYVRFRDLQSAGVVGNWEQLRNLINEYGFPPGVLLSPNSRAWNIEDVKRWLANRPVERESPRGRANQTADAAA